MFYKYATDIEKHMISNPDTKFKDGYNDDRENIYWKANSGYDKPVTCEHVCLNFSLILKGHKLYINPLMIYNR
uniref:Uncharacterized protein n=1 Tax=viral metagenome TaxID=1070528 RepID=A0A6C0J937_9ZZZZ